MRFQFFPYEHLRDAFAAAEAVYVQEVKERGPYMQIVPNNYYDLKDLRPIVQNPKVGVFRYNETSAFNGYTIYSVGQGKPEDVHLIDMAGRVVHQWHLPYAELFENLDGPGKEKVRVKSVYPFSNGDLIVIYTGNSSPWGRPLAKWDKDSNLIWAYKEMMFHHDLDVSNNGDVYALTHRIEKAKREGLEWLEPPLLDDGIAILDGNGRLIKHFSILEAFRDSKYSSVLRLAQSFGSKGDIIHANAIRVIDHDLARKFPFAEEGQLLISLRNIDTLAVVDPDTESVVWAVRGYWRKQHDPNLLDNGNILLFDNRGDFARNGASRILEFNPNTMEIVWSYAGSDEEEFFSGIGSWVQRLANGNTLVTEYDGRMFELTHDKKIVWEYFQPHRVMIKTGELAVVNWAQRYAPEDLEFEFNGGLD